MKNPISDNQSENIEIALVKKSLQGDKDALNQLIQLHQPFIYNVAWKYTNDQEEAKDLTQEVFIKVITNLSSFEGKSSFKTWVYRIVVNLLKELPKQSEEKRFKYWIRSILPLTRSLIIFPKELQVLQNTQEPSGL